VIVIQDSLTEKLAVTEGSIVTVNNWNGKFNVIKREPN
jgi:hypothetical protein